MKVLVVTYKANISGGSNRAMLEVIDTLLQQGHEVWLLVPKVEGELYREAEIRKINCVYIPYTRVGISYPRKRTIRFIELIRMELKLIHDWYIILKYKRDFIEHKFDIVYSNGSATHFGRMLAKQLKIPHVWHVREFFGIDQLLPIKAYQRMGNRTDKYIVISNAMKKVYDEKLGDEKVIMISDGMIVPPEYSKEKHEGFNVLLTGRIAPAKLQLDAVKGFEYFKQMTSNANAKLFLAGSPVTEEDRKYMQTIQEYIDSCGLGEDVTFLGQVENMAKLRSGMDVELMCSEREPFGRVTIEGMRAGLPIIGTASGGTLDIIEEGVSGLFYQPGDYQELGKKMFLLFNNREYLERLSESARKYGYTHFTEKQLLMVVDLLERTSKENKCG